MFRQTPHNSFILEEELLRNYLKITGRQHVLNGLFPRTTWVSRIKNARPIWILMKQDIMGWQWHQLDQVQIICTSLQTDNNASTLSFNFHNHIYLFIYQKVTN